ncbi:MAG: antibiotic biosynthesis monooxygenase [Ignavibacteriaceae bacterium]
MFIVIWEYKVKPGSEEEFEQSYGPKGDWVKFFKSNKEYLGTELIKGIEASRSYVTIDRFDSEKAYVDYLEKHKEKYEELDDRFTLLTEFETKIGSFNSLND